MEGGGAATASPGGWGLLDGVDGVDMRAICSEIVGPSPGWSRLTFPNIAPPRLVLLLWPCAPGKGLLPPWAEELLREMPLAASAGRLCAWPISPGGGDSSNDEMLIRGILSCLSTSRSEYDLESATHAIESRRTARVLPGKGMS